MRGRSIPHSSWSRCGGVSDTVPKHTGRGGFYFELSMRCFERRFAWFDFASEAVVSK